MAFEPISRASLQSAQADFEEKCRQKKIAMQETIGYKFANEMYNLVMVEAERGETFCYLNTYKMSEIAIKAALRKIKEYFPDCDITNSIENPLMAPNMSKIGVSWN